MSKYIQKHWRLLLNLATLAALILMVSLMHDQLSQTVRNLSRVSIGGLLLLLPLQLLNYDAQARLYKSLFAIAGHRFRYRDMFAASLELNFVNHVFPSGGVSGISYFGARLRSGKLSGSRATMVQLFKLALVFISFELILIVGVGLLALTGNVNNLIILLAASLTTLIIIGSALFVFVISSKNRINALLLSVVKGLNKLLQWLRPSHQAETISQDKARRSFDDLSDSYKLIVRHKAALKQPMLSALMINLTEILTIYVVYLAFGSWVNIGAIILAYAVANFAGLVSVLPGGVGIYEALMVSVLVAAGIPAGLSLSVTITFRVLSSLLQLPPGYILYHRSLSGRGLKFRELE